MSKKGITDIIAIVLLLMITISMIGFAWLWFNRLSQTTMNRTQTQLDSSASVAGQLIFIDSIAKFPSSINVTIKNIGTNTIVNTSLKIYANGQLLLNCSGPISDIAPGATTTCNITAMSQTVCGNVLVTAPGNRDTLNC